MRSSPTSLAQSTDLEIWYLISVPGSVPEVWYYNQIPLITNGVTLAKTVGTTHSTIIRHIGRPCWGLTTPGVVKDLRLKSSICFKSLDCMFYKCLCLVSTAKVNISDTKVTSRTNLHRDIFFNFYFYCHMQRALIGGHRRGNFSV